MFKSLNKAISTPLAIIIIIVLAVIAIGGVLAYQYWQAPEEKARTGTSPLGLPGNGEDSSNYGNGVLFQRSDFPEEISGYILDGFYILGKECIETKLYGELCTEGVEIRYVSEEETKRITVFLSLVSKGREAYEESIKENTEKISNGIRKFPAKEELGWFAEKYIFLTLDYHYLKKEDGSSELWKNTADPNNVVVQYFLNKYPSIE